MPVLGITGGIASGKSSFTRAIQRHFQAQYFDADHCAHELLEQDPAVREQVAQLFGPGILGPDPQQERIKLREIVFSDQAKRRGLEKILHPAIQERWNGLARETVGKGGWFCVDLPLLFEIGAEASFDRIIVVACSPGVQRSRLRTERGLSDEMAQKIIATQFDLRLKIEKADHLIWNDSTLAAVEEQSALLAGWLSARYG